MFYVLCFIFYILYYILYFIFYILYYILYIIYFILYILYNSFFFDVMLLLQNFTIEAVVQRCFFREFSTNNSTSNNSSTSTNNSYKNPTNNTKNTNTNKALTIPSKGVMNLCEIMKQRMTLSQRTADTPNVDSQDSTFPIRSCSVILQDDSGATAELVVPDEYASQWYSSAALFLCFFFFQVLDSRFSVFLVFT